MKTHQSQFLFNFFFFEEHVGLYEIRFIFSQIHFFSVWIFLDSFLMVKLNCINQKACLIN